LASIESDVAAYEKWLRKQCRVDEAGLQAKHRRMGKSPFDFLRATYFRWARTIEALCPHLADAPPALCIGDIHIENYGTWRDADARLVWGINDFDEAAVMPYAHDLVRLTTSALLAPDLKVPAGDVADAVLKGYARGLAEPKPFLLDQERAWLRLFVNPTGRSNRDFWDELGRADDVKPEPAVKRALKRSLPEGAAVQRYATRLKGGGSLGRPRVVAIATWQSGQVVREAKALVPSAWDWAHGKVRRNRFLEAAYGPFRSPDPHLRIEGGYLLRRIAPDSRKIEVTDVQVHGLTEDLFVAMAADLAAVHAASPKPQRLARDLQVRPTGWLLAAVTTARQAVERDFARYRAPRG